MYFDTQSQIQRACTPYCTNWAKVPGNKRHPAPSNFINCKFDLLLTDLRSLTSVEQCTLGAEKSRLALSCRQLLLVPWCRAHTSCAIYNSPYQKPSSLPRRPSSCKQALWKGQAVLAVVLLSPLTCLLSCTSSFLSLCVSQ